MLGMNVILSYSVGFMWTVGWLIPSSSCLKCHASQVDQNQHAMSEQSQNKFQQTYITFSSESPGWQVITPSLDPPENVALQFASHCGQKGV